MKIPKIEYDVYSKFDGIKLESLKTKSINLTEITNSKFSDMIL